MKITQAQQRLIDKGNSMVETFFIENIQTDTERIMDIHKELDRIDKHYNKETAADIKKKMCAVILGNI